VIPATSSEGHDTKKPKSGGIIRKEEIHNRMEAFLGLAFRK